MTYILLDTDTVNIIQYIWLDTDTDDIIQFILLDSGYGQRGGRVSNETPTDCSCAKWKLPVIVVVSGEW